MKMIKRIGAILITIAMLASMSVCVFANETTKLSIESVTAVFEDNEDPSKDGIYTITVNYALAGAGKDTQVTMLAYVFDPYLNPPGEGEDAAEKFDAAKQEQESNYGTFIEGATRAIDQSDCSGTITFSLLKAAPDKLAPDKIIDAELGRAAKSGDYLLVKMGTNMAGVSSQAFFVPLADAKDVNEPTTYTITYVAGEEDDCESFTEQFIVGKDYELAENPFTAPDGYEFDGWKIGDAFFEEGAAYIAEGDTTVVATWREIEQGGDIENPETYTITYVAGEEDDCESFTEPFTEGVDYELPECTFTAPEGKVFDGWDIGGTVYPAGTSYADFTADTTVTATWAEDTQGGGNEPGDDNEVALGDVDGDGVIGFEDAVAVKENYLWQVELAHPEVADVDGDGVIGFEDAVAIKENYLWQVPFPASGN